MATDQQEQTGQMGGLVDWINGERGTAYVLREKLPAGTEGAWLVEDDTGQQLVLKLDPEATSAAPMRALMATLERLRAGGYPSPRYVATGMHPQPPAGRWTLQERLPGDEAPRIDDALLDQILALNDLQAGAGPPELVPPGGWRHHIVAPILGDPGGPGAFATGAIRCFSPEAASLVDDLQRYVAEHADAPLATGDLVHFDLGKGHVWTEILPHPDHPAWVRPGKITGLIDYEGAVTGDRVFDLVTLLFYNTGPAYREGPHRRMWERACALAGARTVGVYLAHITLRQLGGCVRWHPPDTTRRLLRNAARHWADLKARIETER